MSALHPTPKDLSRELSRVHRWVGLPVLTFALVMTVLWVWKQQLIRQLRTASADNQLERCLSLERRLQALEWVPSPATADAGRCRREAAQRLWAARKPELALRLQQELVRSSSAIGEDVEQLRSWKADLQRAALRVFEQGDLAKAVALMGLTDTTGADPGVASMTAQLQQIWSKNQADYRRAEGMAAKNRWWDALSALNALNHPYWRTRGLALRQTVERRVARIEKERVEVHGPLPYAIPNEKLNALVRERVAAGVPDWQAFGEACRALGGRVVDGGPEATCEP